MEWYFKLRWLSKLWLYNNFFIFFIIHIKLCRILGGGLDWSTSSPSCNQKKSHRDPPKQANFICGWRWTTRNGVCGKMEQLLRCIGIIIYVKVEVMKCMGTIRTTTYEQYVSPRHYRWHINYIARMLFCFFLLVPAGLNAKGNSMGFNDLDK